MSLADTSKIIIEVLNKIKNEIEQKVYLNYKSKNNISINVTKAYTYVSKYFILHEFNTIFGNT